MSRFIRIENLRDEMVLINIDSVGFIENNGTFNRIFMHAASPYNYIDTEVTLEDLEEMLKWKNMKGLKRGMF